jgi:hypothetical protein
MDTSGWRRQIIWINQKFNKAKSAGFAGGSKVDSKRTLGMNLSASRVCCWFFYLSVSSPLAVPDPVYLGSKFARVVIMCRLTIAVAWSVDLTIFDMCRSIMANIKRLLLILGAATRVTLGGAF